jgi:hypothetical protein
MCYAISGCSASSYVISCSKPIANVEQFIPAEFSVHSALHEDVNVDSLFLSSDFAAGTVLKLGSKGAWIATESPHGLGGSTVGEGRWFFQDGMLRLEHEDGNCNTYFYVLSYDERLWLIKSDMMYEFKRFVNGSSNNPYNNDLQMGFIRPYGFVSDF